MHRTVTERTTCWACGCSRRVASGKASTRTDFQPRRPSTKAAVADQSIAAGTALLRPLWRIYWGVQLHDVDDNYIRDANNRPIMKQYMIELNNACRPSP